MTSPFEALRDGARTMPESGILKVANYGRPKPGVIPLWAGEGDLPTPNFISDAASRSLQAGETFYTNNRGLPELRESIARYMARIYSLAMSPDEFTVTGGGMQAIMLALQATCGAGDEVLVPTPAWPNFRGAVEIVGSRCVPVPMQLKHQGWHLDLDRLFAAATPKTRAIIINSPANPTGWTARADELKAILDFARVRGLWIIADEIYARFCYAPAGSVSGSGPVSGVAMTVAPSFLQIREPDDRVIFVNTFSKNWSMTGWRIGWLQAPPELGQVFENLVQFNTSGTAVFMQRAGLAALELGEPFVAAQLQRAEAGRLAVQAALAASNRVDIAPIAGAFYAFFKIHGEADSMATAIRLVDEAKVGLAPGMAFGESGEGYMRLCFLRSQTDLSQALSRLSRWLASSR